MENRNTPHTISSQVPLRVSLVGGGSDVEEFFAENTGAVINFTIHKFARCHFSPRLPFSFEHSEESEDLIYSVFKALDIKPYGKIHLTSEAPYSSGLGASSALIISLLHTLSADQNLSMSKFEIAELAYHIERNIMKVRGGWQDQIACSYLGVNFIRFNRHQIDVIPITSTTFHRFLIENFYLVYSGIERDPSIGFPIASKDLIDSNNETFKSIEQNAALAYKAQELISKEKHQHMATIINHSWQLKQHYSNNICRPEIKELIDGLLRCGACSAKLLGAGQAGHILVQVAPKNVISVKKFLSTRHLALEPFQIFF